MARPLNTLSFYALLSTVLLAAHCRAQEDMFSTANTSQEIHECAPGRIPTEHLRVTHITCSNWSAEDFSALKDCPALVSVEFMGMDCTRGQPDLAVLKVLPSLRHIRMVACHGMTDGDIESLACLTALETLEFRTCNTLCDTQVILLWKATALRTLSISMCKRLTPHFLNAQSDSSLVDLRIQFSAEVDLRDLAAPLRRFPRLASLALGGNSIVGTFGSQTPRLSLRRLGLSSRIEPLRPETLRALLSTETTTEVSLDTQSFDEGVSVELQRLGKLDHLHLANVADFSEGALRPLLRAVSLTQLTIVKCASFTGESLSVVENNWSLRTLTVIQCPALSEDFCAQLCKYKAIEKCVVTGVRALDSHRAGALAHLSSLLDLVVTDCDLDDNFVSSLIGRNPYRSLDLRGNRRLTAKCVPALAQLTSLRELKISASGSITPLHIAKLRAMLPTCTVN